MSNTTRLLALLLVGLCALGVRLGAQARQLVQGTGFGEPITGITELEFELFRLGLEDFLELENADEGLGPIFNGRSCAECHAVPRIGGSGTMTEVRAGILHPDGSFEEFPGGSVFQLFSIPVHEVQDLIPAEANVVARRKPLPLFGGGLVDAVPDEVLLALEDPQDEDGDGISGRAHWIEDPASGQMRVGRFGWKAQQATLMAFGAEAYRDEMGITNDLFPDEACPLGDCSLIDLVDRVPDPEDGPERSTGLRGIDNFDNFMKLLGPPPRTTLDARAERGRLLFSQIQCSGCHTPELVTGSSSIRALSHKRFAPYGDFLLHDIGSGDGIQQGDARPHEIRTPPLWGVRVRAPFFHDGSVSTLREAVLRHAVEAAGSREAFEALSAEDQDALIAFLRTL